MRSLKRPALAGNTTRWIVGAALWLCAAQSSLADWNWQLPAGFPEPLVPLDNPMSLAKVTLGELLFFERGLSVNAELSCADCHQPQNHFIDSVKTPTGALGEALPFNTPTLWNSAYSASFSWIDKGLGSLEQQHVGPLTNTAPVELGMGPEQLATLSHNPDLVAAAVRAFPDDQQAEPVLTLDRVAAALASYVRTLIKGDSAFDAYLFGDNPDALSDESQAGLQLFTSSRLNCAACHRGFLLSGPTRSTREAFPPSFYQTGLTAAPEDQIGDGEPAQGFRAPSLRFVTHTAPYMHDGRMDTLDEVIDFYAAGGQPGTLDDKSRERMTPFTLSPAERRALLAFLGSL